MVCGNNILLVEEDRILVINRLIDGAVAKTQCEKVKVDRELVRPLIFDTMGLTYSFLSSLQRSLLFASPTSPVLSRPKNLVRAVHRSE